MTAIVKIKIITEEEANKIGRGFDEFVNEYLARYNAKIGIVTVKHQIPIDKNFAIIAFDELEKLIELQVKFHQKQNIYFKPFIEVNGQDVICGFVEHPSEYLKIKFFIQNGFRRAQIIVTQDAFSIEI